MSESVTNTSNQEVLKMLFDVGKILFGAILGYGASFLQARDSRRRKEKDSIKNILAEIKVIESAFNPSNASACKDVGEKVVNLIYQCNSSLDEKRINFRTIQEKLNLLNEKIQQHILIPDSQSDFLSDLKELKCLLSQYSLRKYFRRTSGGSQKLDV